MADILTLCAVFVLVTIAVGLLRLLRGPATVDRLAAMQLVGSGSTAALVLLSIATDKPALVDLAIVLAVLSTFASAAVTLKIAPVGPKGRTDAVEP